MLWYCKCITPVNTYHSPTCWTTPQSGNLVSPFHDNSGLSWTVSAPVKGIAVPVERLGVWHLSVLLSWYPKRCSVPASLCWWCWYCLAAKLWVLCRVSLGSESGIYEFPSGKLRLREVGSRNYEWESGASRQHPEFPSWKNMAAEYDLEGKILSNCVCNDRKATLFVTVCGFWLGHSVHFYPKWPFTYYI